MFNSQSNREELLLKNLRKGSEEAFEQIFKAYWHPLYTIARSKVQSHEEAEEIIQSIFSTIWEKKETLLITNLSHYLQACVRNRVINHIRLKVTQEKYWEYYKNFIPQQKEITEDLVAFDNLSEAVEEAVSRLPEKSRQVFRLSRLEGRSKKEIAKLLQLSEKAIEYHLTKSIKELRVHLKDFILVSTLFIF
jgi:RNA polymerase sigma-70 factor (ECF subfamily)